MDIILLSIDNESLEMQFSGAYNSAYLLRQTTEEYEISEKSKIEIMKSDTATLFEFKADRQPVAVHIVEFDFTTQHFQLKNNDIIYACTDGYADQVGGEKNKKFMSKNFKKFLLEIFINPINQQREILNTNIEKWKNHHEQVDDILVIGIKI